jgi:SAM-dependent methyltransferase
MSTSSAKPFRRPEDVYLKEDRYEEPKEIFKFLGRIIADLELPADAKVLDVGCATGELIYYLKRLNPGFRALGIDPSGEMIAQAGQRVSGAEFAVGSLLDDDFFAERRFDLVVCSGVIPYFRDLKPPLYNLLAAAKRGGNVVVLNSVNEDPIDTHLLYRSADAEDGPWLPDCTYSKRTYEKLLAQSGYELETSWQRFRMPFALP